VINKVLKKHKWIVPAIAVAVIALLIYVGATSLRESRLTNHELQIRTGSAESGDIELSVAGAGSLQAVDSVNVEIPAILPLAETKVEPGDIVKAGDVLATLDAAELQKAVSQVQDEIAAIDKQISDAKSNTAESKITAPVAGRVKEIAAAEDDNLTDVMVQYGYLMVLSVDGKLKADIKSAEKPAVGSDITVVLPDGNKESGRVVSSGPSGFTVTLTDNGPMPGEAISVQDREGRVLGGGALDINAPLNIVGGGGTVKSVNVKPNDRVGQGQTLITLTDTVATQEYQNLVRNRISYEKTLRELLKYAETNTIVAEIDGSITDIGGGQQAASPAGIPQVDIGSLFGNLPISKVGGEEIIARRLVYTPGENAVSQLPFRPGEQGGAVFTEAPGDDLGDDEPPPAIVEIVGTINLPIAKPVLGGAPQTSIPAGPGYTGTLAWDPMAVLFAPGTVYTAVVILQAGPGYRFSDDIQVKVAGATIENLTVGTEDERNRVSFRAKFPATEALPQGIDLEQYISDILQNTLNESLGGALDGAFGGLGDFDGLGNFGGTISIDGSSMFPGGASSSAPSTAMTTLCTITPGKEFSMVVDIDEIDIFSIEVGQASMIVMDAMLDEVFAGEVVKVSTVGASQGGVTTYPVTVLLDMVRTPLLGGMNATANIVTEVKKDVLIIPLDALQERGEEMYVYMYDPQRQLKQRDGQQLGEIRIVTTGISDGVNVEIISGLEAGEEIIYTVIESNVFMDAITAMSGSGGNRNRQDT